LEHPSFWLCKRHRGFNRQFCPEIVISTTPPSIATRLTAPGAAWSAKLHRHIQQHARRKTIRRRNVRLALLGSNVLILAVIMAFVLQNPHTATQSSLNSSASAAEANPLDQVSSADIALTVARMNSLPETTAINNQAQSQAAEVAQASSSNNVTAKPAVVATALKSKADIQIYTVQAGETISSLATRFGITSDSIRWSNGLSGDAVAPGTKLKIPPVTGIVYTIKGGDTADSLATRFGTSKDQILAYNDAEINGLQVGEDIIIPNASQSATTASGIARGSGGVNTNAGFPWGSGPLYGYNGYDYGYCTWYVATQINVPANWGNASTWAYYARLSGWNVSSTPTVGAIAQRGGGEGHVGIVVAVNPDGTFMMRDMNGFAGWGRVGEGTRQTSSYQYITH
jgi:LysM repeat protein